MAAAPELRWCSTSAAIVEGRSSGRVADQDQHVALVVVVGQPDQADQGGVTGAALDPLLDEVDLDVVGMLLHLLGDPLTLVAHDDDRPVDLHVREGLDARTSASAGRSSRCSGLGRSERMRLPSPAASTITESWGTGPPRSSSWLCVRCPWLAGQDSNLHSPDPKSGVLPIELPATDYHSHGTAPPRVVSGQDARATHGRRPTPTHRRGERLLQKPSPTPRAAPRTPGRPTCDQQDHQRTDGARGRDARPTRRTARPAAAQRVGSGGGPAAARRQASARDQSPERPGGGGLTDSGCWHQGLHLARAVAAVLAEHVDDRWRQSQSMWISGSNNSSCPACAPGGRTRSPR